MKVKELISILQKFPQDTNIILNGYMWYNDNSCQKEFYFYEGNIEEIEYDKTLNSVIIHGEDISK